MDKINAPRNRAEFERHLYLLQKNIIDGKVRFVRNSATSGLGRVRFLPNGRIDFLSVDESVRLYANMMAQLNDAPLPELLEADRSADVSPNLDVVE